MALPKLFQVKTIDKEHFNYNAQDFIPIACHYNNETLLTKNGELIQILQVNGVNSEYISDQLLSLRSIVREALKNNITSNDVSCWIHTIRHHTNLDDSAKYSSLLADFIHNIWSQKNYWREKFVNTLYISIVYKGGDLKIKNLSSFLNSLSFKSIENFHNQFLAKAIKYLSCITDGIIEDLQQFSSTKLSIRIKDDQVYSDLLFFYRRIIHLSESKVEVQYCDCSLELATHQYSFGSDKLEVINDKIRKFAAIVSIKEYVEVTDELISECLQAPVEFIATEIFYFVDKGKATKDYKLQASILKASNDQELAKLKGIEQIFNANDESLTQFCDQQINIMVIADSVNILEQRVSYVSKKLAKLGIVHIREDINLAATFWSQLPGNFNFIRRAVPNVIANMAALASLHNYPTGLQYNIWGKAVTILRTERGTPYFMNFHNKESQGHTCIFGTTKSGRTTITNFLLSEASKYDPIVLYLTSESNSQIFVEAIGGRWYENALVIHPLSIDDSQDLLNFFRVISGHYTNNLNEQEIECAIALVETILNTPVESRLFSRIEDFFSFKDYSGGESFKKRIESFIGNDGYGGIFDQIQSYQLADNNIAAVSLKQYTDSVFSESYIPKPREKPEVYQKKLQLLQRFRSSIILSLISKFNSLPSTNPKILVIDNMTELLVPEIFINLTKQIADKLSQANGIILSTAEINQSDQFFYSKLWKYWLDLNKTHIILPTDSKKLQVSEIFNLDATESQKYKTLLPKTRLFIIKQDSHCIVVELNLEGFPGIRKILSAKDENLEYFYKIKQKNGSNLESWLNDVYNKFQNN